MSPDNAAWYDDLGASDHAVAGFDAVLMRKDPPFDVEFLNATLLLSRAAALGARVVNDARALRDHNEKLAILEFPQFTVPTLVTREADRIRAFWADHGDIVVKPLDGMGGAGVFRLQPGDPNAGSILETVTAHGTRTAMAQKFIPAIRDGDKRVLVIDGEPVPYCLARIPKAGETRGNLAAGGTGRAQALSPRDREIARRPSDRRYCRAACACSASTSSATTSPRSTSPAPPASSRLRNRPAAMSRACLLMHWSVPDERRSPDASDQP